MQLPDSSDVPGFGQVSTGRGREYRGGCVRGEVGFGKSKGSVQNGRLTMRVKRRVIYEKASVWNDC